MVASAGDCRHLQESYGKALTSLLELVQHLPHYKGCRRYLWSEPNHATEQQEKQQEQPRLLSTHELYSSIRLSKATGST